MKSEDVLNTLRQSEALLEGHFELRSGLHSDRYFQCANVLRYPLRAELLCKALSERLLNVLDCSTIDGVVSPAMGGIVVGHEVARALKTLSIFVEKRDGVLELRRFNIEPGQRWVVAEDVVTRGGRVQETINIVRSLGAEVAAVAVLVDRSEGATDFGAPFVSLLEMAPTVYVPDRCPLCRADIPLLHPGS